ncbi:hypothetical protein [Kitasatospora purpeofusca]|uniref:hypothetical protein n=1 Tax=Kitasatospora purpeofusca TaxID=67352 RepID=UPI0038693474|nr:hypothetical protein OIP63_21725 [Kitasatospora purpeofusca]
MMILSTWDLTGVPAIDAPATLSEACMRVGRDILQAISAKVPQGTQWMLAEDNEHGQTLLLGLNSEKLQFSRSIDLALSASRLTKSVAELVQDHLAGFEFIQWPICPGHTHPMVPASDDTGAWWRCRSTARNVVSIGELPPSARPTSETT